MRHIVEPPGQIRRESETNGCEFHGQCRMQATQRDAVMIFFAGHGKRDEQTNFYFLPVEADLDDLASTGLSEGDFKAAVKALPGRVILLLDACHSGALIENDRRSGDGLTDKLYRDLTSNEYGLVMMCSSKGVEVSKESNEHKSSLVALARVEGLQGKGETGTFLILKVNTQWSPLSPRSPQVRQATLALRCR